VRLGQISPNSSPDQKNETEQQPRELSTLSEIDKSQGNSHHVPPLVSETIRLQIFRLTIAVLPFTAGSRNKGTLATVPFQRILKRLADIERDDPKFAFPAARLDGLYRRLWEPCVSKHIYGERLEQSIQIFNETDTHLRKEMDCLQLRHDRQLSRLRFFEQALEYSRERRTSMLDDWNYPSRLNLTGLPDGARGG
jgi:hypothetical protein